MGAFSAGYRAWYIDGEWVPLLHGVTHAVWAKHYLGEHEIDDQVANAELMKLGGIKQWGGSFAARDLDVSTLTVIQNRVQEMVNTHLSGYGDRFEISWGRAEFLSVPAEELLYAKHMRDLLPVYRTNSHQSDLMFGDRAWWVDGSWHTLPERYTHKMWADEFLSKSGTSSRSAQPSDSESMLLSIGGIKQWGGEFVIWKPLKKLLRVIQDRLMELQYPMDADVHITHAPWFSESVLSGEVRDILEADNLRDLQMASNGSDLMFDVRAWCVDGEWYSLEDRDTHDRWAWEFLNNLDSKTIGYEWLDDPEPYLIAIGGIKQWGWHFYVAKFNQQALRIIQKRLEQYPPGMRVEIWSQEETAPINAMVFELLDAKSFPELRRMTPNSTHWGVRGWIIGTEWHAVSMGSNHAQYAKRYLEHQGFEVSSPDDAEEYLLHQGGIKIWGTSITVGRANDDGLGMLQEVLMDNGYDPELQLMLVMPPYLVGNMLETTVEEVLDANSWARLARRY
jgi:hypothetical protein